jgi:hypothetical protein
MDVNALLSVIREQFPAEPKGLADTLSLAIEESGDEPGGEAGSPDARRVGQVVSALQGAVTQLSQQITELGELMRSPQVVSDRWNLLAELQRFRSRFREEIGDLVYDSASVFEELRREEVVPGHAEAVSTALLVRATVSDLRRVVGARRQTIRDAESEDVQWNAQQMEKEMDLFGQTPAYAALRAQDKRTVIEFRQRLGELTRRQGTTHAELLALVEPFAEVVSSLDKVNKRQILISHDREVLAACGVRLEHADQTMSRDPAAAARLLAEATLTAQALYGRDGELDAFLRRSRKRSLATLDGPELQQNLDQLRSLLANLQI